MQLSPAILYQWTGKRVVMNDTKRDDEIALSAFDNAANVQHQERSDAAANRALILETAEKLFASRGVAEVNMADIAEAAAVGKGTLYRRFANKGELCLALMDSQMREFQDNMLARLRQMTINGTPRLTQLTSFLEALVYFSEAHSPLLCEVQRSGSLKDVVESSLDRPLYWQYLTVNALLGAAVDNGEVASEADVDYLTEALLAPLTADAFRFQRQVRGFTLERISAGLRQLVDALSLIE
jgi:AcrR family transcriptional regulator